MKCKKCGREVHDKAGFCPDCGDRLNPYMDEKDFCDDQISEGSEGFSIASMVLGIVSLVLCCSVYISLICAVIGLILGIVAIHNNNPGRGMAIAGVVCSSIALVLLIIIVIAGLSLPALLNSYYSSF